MHAPRQNPFPGLRPFGEEEDYLFFGREEQTLELVSLLRRHRFLAVVGSSGSGKSSLVRAGLLPALHGGTMAQAGSSWEVVVMKPGGAPIENLAKALIEADFYDPEDEESQFRLEATLTRSRQGLVEAVKQSEADPDANTLVVVDQFEEIFRFRQQGISAQEAAGAFVDLLLQAANQDERRIFIALTMRSDYLGDCAQIPGLAEAVNDGEYLIPRLGRQQRRDAIEKPVHVGGAVIAERLVQRLLNDVGDNADQLPVLQHALMRTWDVWEHDHGEDEPIDLRHYELAGGMESALSLHADSVFDGLPDDAHREVAVRLFKTLTERTADNREIRRPGKLADLEAIVGASSGVVRTVIDAYRRPGVTFLMPTSEVEVTAETVIDISHESLMRVWERLRQWVDEEAQSARIYQRLRETALLWKQGKAGLYHDPDLSIAQAWHEQNTPNAAWAQLYGRGFEEASEFLRSSHDEAARVEQRREEARQRELAQAKALADSQARTALLMKRFAATVLVALLVAVGLAILAVREADRAEAESRRAEERELEARDAMAVAKAAEEVAEVQQGKTALALARNAGSQQQFFYSRLIAARAVGFTGFGRPEDSEEFDEAHPVLLRPRTPEWAAATALVRGSNLSVPVWIGPQLLQHDGQVSAVAVNPAGTLVATSSESDEDPATGTEMEPEIHVWDLKSGDLIKKLAGHPIGPEALAFSPDGSVLVSSPDDGDTELIFWDTGTWTEMYRISMNVFGVHAVTWSPDGRFLAGGDEEGKLFVVEFRDLRKGDYHPIRELAPDSGLDEETRGNRRVTTVVFTPDSKRVLVSRRDGTIESRDPLSLEGEVLVDTAMFGNSGDVQIQAIDLSPDGRWLVAGLRRIGALLWDLGGEEPKLVGDLLEDRGLGGEMRVTTVRFSEDGKRLAAAWFENNWSDAYGGNDHVEPPTISVFDGSRLPEVVPLQHHVTHANGVGCLAFVPGSETHLLVSGDHGGLVRVIEADRDPAELGLPAGHACAVSLIRFSPDGRWILSSDGLRGAFLWDARTGALKAELHGHQDWVSGGDFSPDSRIAYTGDRQGRTIFCWEVATGKCLATIPCDFRVDQLLVSPDGSSLAVSGASQNLALYRLGSDGTPQEPPQLVPVGHWSTNLAFLPDGRILSSGWRSERPTITLSGPDASGAWGSLDALEGAYENRQSLRNFAVHPSGSRFATSNIQGKVISWTVGSDNVLQRDEGFDLNTPSGDTRQLAYSPDGTLLATAGPGGVTVWNAQTGAKVGELSESASTRALAFSPDGTHLVTGGGDGLVRLWRLDGGEVLSQLGGLDGVAAGDEEDWSGGPWGLAFVDDGASLLVGGGFPDRPSSVGRWDSEGQVWKQRLEVELDGAPVRQIKLSPDGRYLAVTADDGDSLGGFEVWDLQESRRVATVDVSACSNIAFHPSGRFLAAMHRDLNVRIWEFDAEAGCRQVGDAVPSDSSRIRDLVFTPDGTRLVVAGGRGPRVFAFSETGQLGEEVQLTHMINWGLAVSGDGALLASLSLNSRSIKIWDLASGEELSEHPIEGSFWPLRAAFAPGGGLLAVGGTNGHLGLFDISDPTAPTQLADFQGEEVTREVVFSPDGSVLAAARLGGVTFYDVARLRRSSDLTVYLDALQFTDTGLEWESRSGSLRSSRMVLEPKGDAISYLDALSGASSPQEESARLFDYYLTLGRFEAALAVVRAREGGGLSEEEESRFRTAVSAAMRRSVGETGELVVDLALQRALEQSGLEIALPADLRMRRALHQVDWDAAVELLVEDGAEVEGVERQALLTQVCDAVGRHLSSEEDGESQVPIELVALVVAKRLQEDLETRWTPGSSMRIVPGDGEVPVEAELRALLPREVILATGGAWRAFPEAGPPPADWLEASFDDHSWRGGPAPIGFGDGDLATEIVGDANRQTYYFRRSFDLAAAPGDGFLEVRLQVDDGALVHLNGEELLRVHLPTGVITDDTPANHTVGTEEEQLFRSFAVPSTAFRQGKNQLAVEVHQATLPSSDIRLDLGVWSGLALPREATAKAVALADRLRAAGHEADWLGAAGVAFGESAPDEEVFDLVFRSRWERLVGRSDAERGLLEVAATRLEGSDVPADWRRYRDILARLESIATAQGDESVASELLGKILAAPARPAATPATQLDLTDYYNSSLYDGRGWMRNRWKDINMAPVPEALVGRGNGIGFDVRGIIQLDSGVYQDNFGAAENAPSFVGGTVGSACGHHFPLRMDGIQVSRRCRAIHLLTGALHTRAPEGAELGKILFHYVDGSQDTLSLRLKENTYNYWFGGQAENLAWQGRIREGNATHAVAHTTWQNPKPELEVESIDLVSAEAQGAPFVVAITVEE